MLLLTTTTDRLRLVTSSAADIHIHASYADYSAGAFSVDKTATVITSATTTDNIVGAPGASTQRNVRNLVIRNKHASTANDVTLQFYNGTTAYELFRCILSAGETLAFNDGTGFQVFDANGALKLTGPSYPAYDGWIPITDAWAYASATTVTVPTGAQNRYQKGDKFKFTQSSTVKYFYVINVADTVLTLIGNSTVANSAISAVYYSKDESPQGFTTWMDWTPTYTGFSAAPTTLFAKFRIDGTVCRVMYAQNALGTSNATTLQITLPINPATSATLIPALIFGVDNSANVNHALRFDISSAGVLPTPDSSLNSAGGTGWTASGTKGVYGFQFCYAF